MPLSWLSLGILLTLEEAGEDSGSDTAADKARMIELLVQLDVYRRTNGVARRNRPSTPPWAWLRANRGTFDVEREETGIEIVANSWTAWTGWLELATEPVDEVNTT